MSTTPRIMLHLTKTAGGTLNNALQESKDINVEMVYSDADENRLFDQDHSNRDLFYGHMFFGAHERLGLEETPKHLCFLRHPVTRTISHYYHLRNVDDGHFGEKIRASADINDFFANFTHWEFSDLMGKVISGHGLHGDPDELYEKAIFNVDNHFDFIGFQEFFGLSVRQLNKILGTSLNIQMNVNVGQYSFGDITEETIEKIESINTADIRLYQYALNKFLLDQ